MEFSEAELAVLDQRRPHTCARWLGPEDNLQTFAVVDHGGRPSFGRAWVSAHVDTVQVLAQACSHARAGSMIAGLLGISRAGAAIVTVAHEALGHEALVQMLGRRLADGQIVAVAGPGLEAESDLPLHGTPSPEVLARARGEVLRTWRSCLPAHARAIVVGVDGIGRQAATDLIADGVEVVVWDRDRSRARDAAQALGIPAVEGPWQEVDADLLVGAAVDPFVDEADADRLRARAVISVTPYATVNTATRERLAARDVVVVPEPFGATGDSLALAITEGTLGWTDAIERLRDDAGTVLENPATARGRAIELAIARSRNGG